MTAFTTRAETTKRVRETEAVAFVVCEAIGLKANSSADYIQLYSGEKETLALGACAARQRHNSRSNHAERMNIFVGGACRGRLPANVNSSRTRGSGTTVAA